MKKLFYNQILDKKGTKKILSWFLENYGPTRTSQFIEQLKSVGFHFATEAGLSLGFDDLRVPSQKAIVLQTAESDVLACEKRFFQGKITAVERYQKFIDIWTTASETLKDEVIQNFQNTDLLNPLYMMAFSGARGNISQVRQLVGMRGLMSDSAGGIIDFPIRSNFREGLTVTEYAISCYGARKGLIDTALRTADSGYLTRRLVDVAHGIMIGRLECHTLEYFDIAPLRSASGKSGAESILLSLEKRILGRVLATNIAGKQEHTGSGTSLVAKQRGNQNCVAYKNEEISPSLAQKIVQYVGSGASRPANNAETVPVRSPLTCLHFQNLREDICQLCYGWSLAHGRLVSIGEAVGIIAAQSIGEPGTQLTMRTFHTGGIFSTDIDAKIFAPHDGIVAFSSQVKGRKVRTFHGETAFFTFETVQLKIRSIACASRSENSSAPVQSTSEDSRGALFNENLEDSLQSNTRTTVFSLFRLPSHSLIFVYPGQFVSKNVLCAEVSQLISAKKSSRNTPFVGQTPWQSHTNDTAVFGSGSLDAKRETTADNALLSAPRTPKQSETQAMTKSTPNAIGERSGQSLQSRLRAPLTLAMKGERNFNKSEVRSKRDTQTNSTRDEHLAGNTGSDTAEAEELREARKPNSKRVLSEIEGQIYFHRLAERRQVTEFEKLSHVKGVGSLWVLAGKGIFTRGPFQSGDFVTKSARSCFATRATHQRNYRDSYSGQYAVTKQRVPASTLPKLERSAAKNKTDGMGQGAKRNSLHTGTQQYQPQATRATLAQYAKLDFTQMPLRGGLAIQTEELQNVSPFTFVAESEQKSLVPTTEGLFQDYVPLKRRFHSAWRKTQSGQAFPVSTIFAYLPAAQSATRATEAGSPNAGSPGNWREAQRIANSSRNKEVSPSQLGIWTKNQPFCAVTPNIGTRLRRSQKIVNYSAIQPAKSEKIRNLIHCSQTFTLLPSLTSVFIAQKGATKKLKESREAHGKRGFPLGINLPAKPAFFIRKTLTLLPNSSILKTFSLTSPGFFRDITKLVLFSFPDNKLSVRAKTPKLRGKSADFTDFNLENLATTLTLQDKNKSDNYFIFLPVSHHSSQMTSTELNQIHQALRQSGDVAVRITTSPTKIASLQFEHGELRFLQELKARTKNIAKVPVSKNDWREAQVVNNSREAQVSLEQEISLENIDQATLPDTYSAPQATRATLASGKLVKSRSARESMGGETTTKSLNLRTTDLRVFEVVGGTQQSAMPTSQQRSETQNIHKIGDLIRFGEKISEFGHSFIGQYAVEKQGVPTPTSLPNESFPAKPLPLRSQGIDKTIQIIRRTYCVPFDQEGLSSRSAGSAHENSLGSGSDAKRLTTLGYQGSVHSASKFSRELRFGPKGKNKDILLTLRRVHPYLISNQSPLAVRHGDIVEARQFLFELFYQQSKTGDIVQGLPKIEQLFEARRTSLHVIETVHMRLKEKFQELCSQYPLYEAARRSIRFIQRILIDEIQLVYQSQGVDIADKHIEIIIRQMTSKVIIHEKGKSPFFPDDIIDFHQISQFENQFDGASRNHLEHLDTPFMTYPVVAKQHGDFELGIVSPQSSPSAVQSARQGQSGGQMNEIAMNSLLSAGTTGNKYTDTSASPSDNSSSSGIIFEPIVLGLTKIAFLTQSFISAASFQETKRVLMNSALHSRVDFLYGLKENVIVGRFIRAGTGFRTSLFPSA